MTSGMLADEAGEHAEPEVAFEGAFGAHGLIDEMAQMLGELEAGEVALASDERLEESVVRGETFVE